MLTKAKQLANDVVKTSGANAFTGDQSMGSNKITTVANGTASGDAVNKGQLDAAIAGIDWVNPAAVPSLVGNRTVAQLNALGTVQGDAYVVTDAGTLTRGSVAAVAGDLVEDDGTDWVLIVTNVSNFVPSGTRAVIAKTTALVAPYSEGTDDNKIVSFDGASNTGTDTLETADGVGILIGGEGGVSENRGFVFDLNAGTVPTGTWVEFTGLSTITAGAGMSKSGSQLDVELDTNPGLEFDTAGVAGKLRVLPDPNGGVERVAAGVGVKLNGDSLKKAAAGLSSVVPATGNKAENPSATSGDGSTTGLTIAATPGGDGMVSVFVNGTKYELGQGVKTKDCYLSSDGGTTARAIAAIASGDTLFWNGVVAEFDLETDDKVDMVYES